MSQGVHLKSQGGGDPEKPNNKFQNSISIHCTCSNVEY